MKHKNLLILTFLSMLSLSFASTLVTEPVAKANPPASNCKALLVGMDYDAPLLWYQNATALEKALRTWSCWRNGVIKKVGPKANKDQIIASLSALNVGSNDFFIFYYSGHGTFNPGNEKSPALNTAEERLYATNTPKSLTDDDLKYYFGTFVNSNATKLVILDCCYSGGFWNGTDEGDVEKLQRASLLASANETSTSPARSDFTRYLVEGIDRTYGRAPADNNPVDGQVTAKEWFDYVKKKVPTGPIFGYRKQGEMMTLAQNDSQTGDELYEDLQEMTVSYNDPQGYGNLDCTVSLPSDEFGGIIISANKPNVWGPYVGLASILVATTAVAVYVKRLKNRKIEQ